MLKKWVKENKRYGEREPADREQEEFRREVEGNEAIKEMKSRFEIANSWNRHQLKSIKKRRTDLKQKHASPKY